MIPSLFNKLGITRLGAATAATTPNSVQGAVLGGRSVDDTSGFSQGLSQLDLDEYQESSEEGDDEDRAIVRDSDETRESFEHIVYEDSDEFSNWSIPSSVPVTPTLSSPTQALPIPSSQEGDDLLLSLVLHQQQQQGMELDQELVHQQEKYQEHQEEQQEEQQEEKQDYEDELRVEQPDHHQEVEQGELKEEHLKQQLHQQLSSPPEELHEEQEHQLQLNHNQQQYYELRLPLDVWIKICSHLYPSQLTRLSLANKAAYNLVASLHVWEAWHEQLHGMTYIEAKHIMQPLPGMPKSHSYMLYMCAISRQVCEKCLRRCDGKQQRGRLASMPLPVIIGRGGYDENGAEEGPWTIRMCKPCRVVHYQSYPEPIPQGITTSFLTKRVIQEKYRLGNKEVQAITTRSRGSRKCGYPVTYSEATALIQSRRAFGGDVGRLAAPKSLCKFMHVLNNRVHIYHRRRQILEAGGYWIPYEEIKALKAAGLL